MLPITLTIAGAAALINIWLAMRVSRIRMAAKISIGDGGNPLLAARMRAHANFTEYAPFFLILLGLLEYARGSQLWLWWAALAFIAARLAHAFGMDRPAPNPLRAGGILVSFVVLGGLAIYAVLLPYLGPVRPPLH